MERKNLHLPDDMVAWLEKQDNQSKAVREMWEDKALAGDKFLGDIEKVEERITELEAEHAKAKKNVHEWARKQKQAKQEIEEMKDKKTIIKKAESFRKSEPFKDDRYWVSMRERLDEMTDPREQIERLEDAAKNNDRDEEIMNEDFNTTHDFLVSLFEPELI